MDPETWFAELTARLPVPGIEGRTPPMVTDEERDALLDLARVAAHTSERWTAPVSTFLAGIALASSPSDERAAAIRALVTDLDRDLDA